MPKDCAETGGQRSKQRHVAKRSPLDSGAPYVAGLNRRGNDKRLPYAGRRRVPQWFDAGSKSSVTATQSFPKRFLRGDNLTAYFLHGRSGFLPARYYVK